MRLVYIPLALVLAVLAAPAAHSSVIESGSPMFTDPLGDVTAAPDVTQVALLHTPPSSLLMWVHTSGEPVLENGSVIELRLDIDGDPSTGAPNGMDRLVHRLWTGSTRVCTWNGASWSCASAPSVTSTYVGGVLAVTATVEALGLTGPFDFSVAAYHSPNVDFAPDSGTWRFPLGPVNTGCATAPAGVECVATGGSSPQTGPRSPRRRRGGS